MENILAFFIDYWDVVLVVIVSIILFKIFGDKSWAWWVILLFVFITLGKDTEIYAHLRDTLSNMWTNVLGDP